MSATKAPKPKTDRKMIGWVFAIGMVLLIIYLFMAKGSDLGQGEINKAKQEQQKKAEAQRYAVKIDDPAQATRQALEKAKEEVKQKEQKAAASQPAATSSVAVPPPPPDPTVALAPPPPSGMDGDVSDLQFKRLEKAHAAADAGSDAGGSTDAPVAGFVVYQAAPPKKGSGTVLGALAVDGAQNQKGGGSSADDDPQVKAAKAQLEAYKAAQEAAAAQKADAAQPGQEGNQKWLFSRQNSKVEAATSIVAKQNKGLYWLAPGTTINAVVLNAIDTRLPGQITARVTQATYDSRYGRYLVIPAGSTLVGSYNSSVADGQKRVMLAFDTLITPSGGEVDLKGMVGADGIGKAGIPGTLHTHFLARMSIATLLALEAVEMDRLSKQTQVVAGTGLSGPPPVSSGGQIIIDAGNEEMKRRFATGPNITVPPGSPMTIITTSGIEIPPIANAR